MKKKAFDILLIVILIIVVAYVTYLRITNPHLTETQLFMRMFGLL